LTERVLEFQRTGRDREAIVCDVAKRIYEYPRKKCRLDEESASEFFVRVYPKVAAMIQRFRYVGRPFESYLSSTLMYQIRSFTQDRSRRELEWEVSANPTLWDEIPCDERALRTLRPLSQPPCPVDPGPWDLLDPPLRQALSIGADGTIHSVQARRRFLILCLKSAHVLADADIAAVSRIAGYPQTWVFNAVEGLRDRARQRTHRVEVYTGRRNRAYYGLRVIEARLWREVDPDRRRELDARRERLMGTVTRCHHVISRIKLAPSHRQVAEALGIPKATVDSTIHRLKRRAAELYARRHERYA
jgi:hypothetical protein